MPQHHHGYGAEHLDKQVLGFGCARSQQRQRHQNQKCRARKAPGSVGDLRAQKREGLALNDVHADAKKQRFVAAEACGVQQRDPEGQRTQKEQGASQARVHGAPPFAT